MRGAKLKKLSLLAIARYVAVVALICAAAFPVYWMFVTSLTPSAALFEGPSFLPHLSEFSTTYLEAFQTIPIATWLLNSLIVAAGTTVLSIAISLYPAYALSRFDFRGKGLAGLGLFVTQMLPEAMLVVPLYAIFGQFNMLNSLTGLIFVNAAFSVPVIIWILKGAIDGVPVEIEEAARVDGCSPAGIVLRIVLPLVAPTLAAAAVIAFFHGWNEYVFAQTMVSSESLRTASVGLAGFVGELSTPIHSVMAVSLIYTTPAILFYLFVQRFVVAGMTAGSVKG
jgi:multiple sugar transport system permease protein